MPDLESSKKRQVIETAIALLLFFALLLSTLTTLSAFLGIFTFAIIFAVPFAPLFEKFAKQLGSRKFAAFLYGLILVAFIALPLIFLISSLIDYAHKAQAMLIDIRNHKIPPLPDWLAGIPYVGDKAKAFWVTLEKDPVGTLNVYEPQIKMVLTRLLSTGGGLISSGLEIIVGIIISAIFLYNRESVLKPVRVFFSKILGPETGDATLNASGRAINGVAVGVMGTALIEALVGWIGFTIAGIDMASGLAAVMFLFAVVQLGPIPVQLPLVIWLFSRGDNGWGIFMLIWLIVLMVVDNVVKPILIGKSGKLPILVLFLGVVGGMGAWGFTGMFKGAIVLAVMYTLFVNWAAKPTPTEG
jgi:predicted PurR-regulated permease PerM